MSIGNTSSKISKGPFSIAMLVYRNVGDGVKMFVGWTPIGGSFKYFDIFCMFTPICGRLADVFHSVSPFDTPHTQKEVGKRIRQGMNS